MKHIYFSGIGGSGIGPLAILAAQAGYRVSGSDKAEISHIKNLNDAGIRNIIIGQTKEKIEEFNSRKPIDWMVYSSAVEKENPNHPELVFAKENGIRLSKRDELINDILQTSGQQMIAAAGTHGKTTTTAMIIWLFKELGMHTSHSLGGKVSFADAAVFNKNAKYFIYEADEYDRNFLAFHPKFSLITGVAYDHPDIFPSRENYEEAFRRFISQTETTILGKADAQTLGIGGEAGVYIAGDTAHEIKLLGEVNRHDAELVVDLGVKLGFAKEKCVEIMNRFPGVYRRNEKLTDNIYTDYAHTPEKISGALQVASEVSDNIAVVYEGLHNTRQHFIKEDLKELFTPAKKIYVVPSFLAREDESLEMLTPNKLCEIIEKPDDKIPAQLNDELLNSIKNDADSGMFVLCFSAGGAGSLDEWLRINLS